MREKISHWLPVGFCVAMSVSCVVTFIGFPGAWVIPFLCFLPMCFLFVGAVTTKLQQEVQELRARIEELQRKPR
ncbi:MAG: hypothetical protein V4675_03715 [Verrucomicrobiota bacterium]